MPKYTVYAKEGVWDAFDDFEHYNTLSPLEVEADTLEDAESKGHRLLQEKVNEERRAGGFMSSGTFLVRVYKVVGQGEELRTPLPEYYP